MFLRGRGRRGDSLARGAPYAVRVLRLVGFFVGVLLLLKLLQTVPVIGGWFHGFIGFWLAALLLAFVLSRAFEWLTRRGKLASQVRALGAVESPHNQGKLGSLLLGNGLAARAYPYLQRAAAGEPELADWHYRLGLAALELGRERDALAALGRASAIDEEYAYGGVQLALSRAHLQAGELQAAFDAAQRFERNHGPNPESAFRRALALKRLGRSDEAKRAFREVNQLAGRAAKFQRAGNRRWVWRAWIRA